ncbi:hypothetical protein ADK67_19425 [Saccharothrix sp. NRRL B-16348]|uniref:hypothetical protein n=1 Tax=Saccharothrix sp. NRRL B-16348 TaxID=1415542 RepID=UPI0006B04600|nr:hypothetical protein [Saccharothrix sp. NRRL B-16348]KOX23950.1 hypothetical protein ADK67_19425 [Saccharothrix sp. NRRL B-16348]
MKAAVLRVAVLGAAGVPQADAVLCVLDGDRVAALLAGDAGDHFEQELAALRQVVDQRGGPVFCVVTRWSRVAERGTASDVLRALARLPGFPASCRDGREPLIISWEGARFDAAVEADTTAAAPLPASLRDLLANAVLAVAAGRTWRLLLAWLMAREITAARVRRVLGCPALPAEALELLVAIAAEQVRDRPVDAAAARVRREDFRRTLRACRARWAKSG